MWQLQGKEFSHIKTAAMEHSLVRYKSKQAGEHNKKLLPNLISVTIL
jgi:hypothetical protein